MSIRKLKALIRELAALERQGNLTTDGWYRLQQLKRELDARTP